MVAIELIFDAVEAMIAAISAAKTRPSRPGRQQPHHRRIGLVGLGQARRQHHRRDPGQDDDQRHQQLQEGREQHALLRLVEALRGQRALDDILVEPPIAQIGDPHPADQHRQAGQVHIMRVALLQDHVEMVRRLVDQLREARREAGAGADPVERQIGDDEPAEHEQGDLDDIGQRHRLQAAAQLVEQGEGAEHDERQILVDPRHLVDRDRAQPDDRGEVHEHVEREPEHRHQHRQRPPVTPREELRHRVDFVLQEDRQEELADDQQGRRRHPFVGGDGEPDRIARARHADDLLGRDVGGDERGADRPPGQVLRRQEIVRRVLLVPLLLAADILGEEEDRDRVGDDDDDIDRCELHLCLPAFRPLCRERAAHCRFGSGII